jgi:competence protein ComEC
MTLLALPGAKLGRFALIATALISCLNGRYQINKPLPNFSYYAKQCLEIQILKVETKYFRRGLHAYGKGIIKDAKDREIIGKTIYFMLRTNIRDLFKSQSFRTYAHIEKIDSMDKNNSFFSYLYRSKIFLYASSGYVEKITDKGLKLFHMCFIAHSKINNGLTKNMTKSFLNILPGMLLSSKTDLSREQKDGFRNTGTAHLLAVSGLHVGIIGFTIEFILRIFGLNKKLRRIPCILILLIYLGIIGSPPSAFRAFAMLSFYWGACYFNRKPNTLSGLINAALLSLLIDPVQLFDPGFRMSYGVVYYIILLGVPLTNRLRSLITLDKFIPKDEITLSSKLLKKIISNTIDSIAISIAANIASIPLTFEYFGSISLVGILANMVVIPIAWVTIVAGTVTMISLLIHINLFTNISLFIAGTCAAAIETTLMFLEKYLPLFWNLNVSAHHYGTAIFTIGLLVLPYVNLYFQKTQKS